MRNYKVVTRWCVVLRRTRYLIARETETHLVLRQELREVFLSWLLKDGQVATAEMAHARQPPAATRTRDGKINNTPEYKARRKLTYRTKRLISIFPADW